jgi:hypothetical protein
MRRIALEALRWRMLGYSISALSLAFLKADLREFSENRRVLLADGFSGLTSKLICEGFESACLGILIVGRFSSKQVIAQRTCDALAVVKAVHEIAQALIGDDDFEGCLRRATIVRAVDCTDAQ